MVNPSNGRGRIRSALAELLPPEHTPTPFALTDLLGDRLDEYAELIVGPGRRVAGFMTRGEDRTFTERTQVALEQLGMPDAAREHHRALTTWFEHLRAFFKVEWQRTPDGGVEPLAACYFRRRPTVDEALSRLSHLGVGPVARELAFDVARALEARSIHFVSASFRPRQRVHHKLYFSQWLTPETRDAVATRIARVFELFGFLDDAKAAWRAQHDRLATHEDATLFVSISFSDEWIVPSFKIDYPEIGPARAALWVPHERQAEVIADAEAACHFTGAPTVSFLGVRFTIDPPSPTLKYYCDVPTADA
jgi:hypothetical protein